MLLNCPICNKKLKEKGEQIAGGVYSIACYDCGAFDIDVGLSQIMRRKYLSFNLEMTMGRESYEENIKIFRDFIRYHRPPLLTKTVIDDMVFLRRP
ncbi:MAG: hypothetical protein K0R76_731 [Alphaproteobacteria bacterium]|jgi:hypothetical protein|nr:hypothetical protein [Alphaproteobacteria bacterium]